MIQSETLELLEWQRLCEHLSTFTATKLGAVAARHLQPPRAKAESLKLLAQTQEVNHFEETFTSGWSFEGIKDVGDSLERAELGGLISGEELTNLATTLAGVRRLRRVINDFEEELPVLSELVADLRTYPELEQEIYRCIDEQGKVSERASPKLAGIRSQIKKLRDRIYPILRQIMQRQGGAVQEQVITQRGDRFVIPVKAPQKDAIPGIVHDTSSTGATLYIEPHAIVELGNQQRQSRRQEQAEEERILRLLTQKVADVKIGLEQLLAVATALDLATAKAHYSNWLEANPPQIIDSEAGENITLRGLRHPLLVWQQWHEQGTPVVPIDIQIQPQIRVVAITGPNTGGKTAALKTVGLAALMAKVGLFVPARDPVEIPWFEQVLADIGDEQSLEQSLSTFSSHIRRISRIIEAIKAEEQGSRGKRRRGDTETRGRGELRDTQTLSASVPKGLSAPGHLGTSAPAPSLVLLDEVGAGTDPSEGSALAIALLQSLAERVQLTIATTHYGELKTLKYQDERFENASVEFDEESLSPTYRLLWGIPGRSNALTVARRLGLEPEIVERAQQEGGFSEEVNQVIAGLEEQRKHQEAKAKEAGELLERAEQFYQEVSQRAANLQEREEGLKRSQEEAVNEAITEAKGEIAEVIRQLQQGSKTARDAHKATEALDEVAKRRKPAPEVPTPKPSYQPQLGERVRVPRLNQTAEVLTLPGESGEVTVRFGLMKMTVSLSDIESLDGKKPDQGAEGQRSRKDKGKRGQGDTENNQKTTPTVQTSQNTVDIRGTRVADAEVNLENAIAQGTGALWIIHGKGTGRLRQGVQEFLKQHSQVERFELAPQNQGGAGVTIAYLR